MTSTPSRTVSGDVAYAPFGETFASSGSPELSFTGQNPDTNANLYDFMYREYGIQGSWPSPDPSGPGAFNLADPQSLDLYAYVRNSPMGLIDPLGLNSCPPGTTGNGSNGTCVSIKSGPLPLDLFPVPYGTPWPTGLPLIIGPSLRSFGWFRPAKQPQTQVSCSTVLPNGQTVGDVVRQEVTALRDAEGIGTAIDNGPLIRLYFAFVSAARPGGPIDFKNNFRGQANPALLGQAGNFAYYAIGSSYLSPFVLDAGAGTYGLATATFGPRSFSDLTGPMFSDSSAAFVRNAALASKGCSQ